jgi:hypothetical protein
MGRNVCIGRPMRFYPQVDGGARKPNAIQGGTTGKDARWEEEAGGVAKRRRTALERRRQDSLSGDPTIVDRPR